MKGRIDGVEVDVDQRYVQQITLLREHGYNPIAVAVLMCEETFCFETEGEAIKAFEEFERDPEPALIQGWWYGRDYFLKTIEGYEKENGYSVTVTWL